LFYGISACPVGIQEVPEDPPSLFAADREAHFENTRRTSAVLAQKILKRPCGVDSLASLEIFFAVHLP